MDMQNFSDMNQELKNQNPLTSVHYTAVTKQWTAKWPYITNVILRIVQNHGK